MTEVITPDFGNAANKILQPHNTAGTLVTEIALQYAEDAGLIQMSDDLYVNITPAEKLPRLLTFNIGEDFCAIATMHQSFDRVLMGTINIFFIENLSGPGDYRRSAQVHFRIKDGFVIGQDDLRDVTEITVDELQRNQLADALFYETNSCIAE